MLSKAEDEKLIQHPTQPEPMLFTDDVPFASPSTAAATVLNRNANGRTEWKVAGTGQPYEDWQSAQLPRTEEGAAECSAAPET